MAAKLSQLFVVAYHETEGGPCLMRLHFDMDARFDGRLVPCFPGQPGSLFTSEKDAQRAIERTRGWEILTERYEFDQQDENSYSHVIKICPLEFNTTDEEVGAIKLNPTMTRVATI